jgi:hypothetical protein
MMTEDRPYRDYLLSAAYNPPFWQVQIVPTRPGLRTRSDELPPIQDPDKEKAFVKAQQAADELYSN